MSVPSTWQAGILAGVEGRLDSAVRPYGAEPHGARLDVLEAVASRLGGFDLAGYRTVARHACVVPCAEARSLAGPVLEAMLALPAPPALCLAALATPPLSRGEQRRQGVYYTDARLALYLASSLPRRPELKVVDPAAGTGVLLVAAALRACGADREARSRFLRHSVHGADLSGTALRGAALALASLTDDLDSVAGMLPRLRVADSLAAGVEAWSDVVPDGFDVVIGNPPWEKLKATRHEVLTGVGVKRHYGAEYGALDPGRAEQIDAARRDHARYSEEVLGRFALQGTGEHDLYKAFLELGARLARPGGHLAFLVPAGLIRSQGTESLRRFLFGEARRLEITVHDNRARFFAIDTRFKFLSLHATFGADGPRSPLTLHHATASEREVRRTGTVRMGRAAVQRFRSDLAVPELRHPAEWSVLRQMTDRGRRFGEEGGFWQPRITREVDMTRDRDAFRDAPGGDRLPLVEGRMIHQFRFGAKAHVSGTGRRAKWDTVPLGRPRLEPQFWISRSALRPEVQALSAMPRVGFCDVTGQTNERSLLAARIPAGVVCGNKVPTIVFAAAGEDRRRRQELGDLWLAVVNSLPFDWMLRRVLTTTVNYFLLLEMPMPSLEEGGLPPRRLAQLSRALSLTDERAAGAVDWWKVAGLRAEIDLLVLGAYGLDRAALEVMLDDFPLLDRGQPPLEGEERSTVTRDFLLAAWDATRGTTRSLAHERVHAARLRGAVPYVPSEHGTHVTAGSSWI